METDIQQLNSWCWWFQETGFSWSTIRYIKQLVHDIVCLVTYLSMSSPKGGGAGVGHRVGISTFFKKNYQNPHTQVKNNCQNYQKQMVYSSSTIWKLKDQMHDVRSKFSPWGNMSVKFLWVTPHPPGLDIDRCIIVQVEAITSHLP